MPKKSLSANWPLIAVAAGVAVLGIGIGVHQFRSATAPGDAAMPKVLIQTTLGDFTLELDADKAPLSVENFLAYVDSGFYDGTIFHRVIPRFVVQGGGFTPDMRQKPTEAPVKNESDNGLSNVRGSIAMARTADPDSATAQFYINLKDNLPLDAADGRPGYTVFGKVVKGLDTLDDIAAKPTGNAGAHRDVPREPIIMEKVKRL